MGLKYLLLLILSWHAHEQSPPIEIHNLLQENQQYTLIVRILTQNNTVLFDKAYDFVYSSAQPDIEDSVSVPVEPHMDNYTITSTLCKWNTSHIITSARANLTRYMKIRGDAIVMMIYPIDPNLPFYSEEEGMSMEYTLHMPTKYVIMPIFMTDILTKSASQYRSYGFKSVNKRQYLPPIDMSQLHIPFKTYLPLYPDRNSRYNFTLSVRLYPFSFYKYLFPFSDIKMLKRMNPLMQIMCDQGLVDMIKEIMFSNSLYWFFLYFFLSCLQIFLNISAFKQEIRTWRKVEETGGLSVRTLYFNLASLLVAFFYLRLHLARIPIIFFYSILLQLVLTLWKISKAFQVYFNTNMPYLHFRYKQWYHHKIEEADRQASHYTSPLLAILFTCYMLYKLYPIATSETVTLPGGFAIYVFVLESLFHFVYIFGIVSLTPQLYINYKMQSVKHLPWKALTYRFICTIIDDVQVLMLNMPLDICIYSFGDDVIFVLSLIQRKMYRVDKNRGMILGEQPKSVKED